MAVKKTSTENSKEVKKKTVTTKKNVKKEEKPQAVKKETKISKADVIRAKASVVKTDIPQNNYNPVDEVLHIKAINDEKKETKLSAKELKKAVKELHQSDASKEKGNKINTDLKRRDEMKEKALKAETKKFLALKEEIYSEECKRICSFSAFLDAYKKVFTYNARTTRYEFWSFKLINLLFFILVLSGFVFFSNYVPSLLLGCLFIGFVLFETLVYISLFVRRLHDTGRQAWKGFFRPMVYSSILYLVAVGCFKYYSQSRDIDIFDEQNALMFIFFSIFLVIIWSINTYYSVKTVIVSFFFEEDKSENEYGLSKLTETEYKDKVIRFASIYFVFLAFIAVVIKAFLTFHSLSYGFN